jgi:4-amino-4-deoxy-L-arabinose transferase-like glycosyltransferase
MENLFGWIFFLIIFLSILIYSNYDKNIKFFLLTAFFLRFLCVLLDQYNLINLPDSKIDAFYFELKALEFSRIQGISVIFEFYKSDSLLISRIISLFYTVFGESKMMAQSISVALGTASVYLVYQICLILWDNHTAKKAAWVTALFPTLILYSSLILREVYIVFILLIGLNCILRFMQKNSFNLFLQILTSFYLLLFFHGPAVVGGFTFLLYVILSSTKKQIDNLYNYKLNLFFFLSFILFFILIILLLTNNYKIPYLGSIQTLFDIENLLARINKPMTSTASYPSWLTINNIFELLTKAVFKIFYFLFSPFIWDIKSSHQLIGLFDGTFYIILAIYVFKNRYSIFQNPVTRIFLLIFITYIVIYGLGIGNFGTGIRHRSKFVVILIILAAPKIHRFIFATHKKLYNK